MDSVRNDPARPLIGRLIVVTNTQENEQVDYVGAIIVVEVTSEQLALVHPGGDRDGPASLPGDSCRAGESPEEGAVRIVREATGLDVEIVDHLVTFVQSGTPTGTMLAHGYVATPVGGALLASGAAGPVSLHRVDALPELVPVRVAIRRVLETYLEKRALP